MKKALEHRHARTLRFLLLSGIFVFALIFLSISYREASSEESDLASEALPPGSTGTASAEQAFQSLPSSTSSPGSLRIPILIYHSVRPHVSGEDAENEAYDITPELLDEELTYLDKNGYTPISMDDFVDYVSRGYSPVLHPVVITFDDGWRNQYVYAFPLLEQHHMTATFFIYTNPIDYQKPHFLSWDMVREMDKAGMEIGGHSVTHPLLYRLTPEKLAYEIKHGKERIEAELGHPIRHFASPFGSTSDLIQQDIRDAGYVTGRTTYKGVYHTPSDFLKLRGVLVDDSLADFIKVLKND